MRAFVIMPILREGTEEHKLFRSIYEYIRTTLAEDGFEVVRADEVQRSGAITADIITRLAEADLVVADLTDLNPNVFYELGVRHALRAKGTILTLDETRTQEIPFDLNAYRVVKYGSQITEIERLRKGLKAATQALLSDDSGTSTKGDNPVHDWLPVLPPNALETATGSLEGALRAEISAQKKSLAAYERRFGRFEAVESEPDLSLQIDELLERARAGELGPDLVRTAQEAAQAQNAEGFLSAVGKLLRDPSIGISTRDYLRLSLGATTLGLQRASSLILQHGRKKHPADEGILNAYLGALAHSYEPEERGLARRLIEEEMGITMTRMGSPNWGRISIGIPRCMAR